jgi:hypothetical protein
MTYHYSNWGHGCYEHLLRNLPTNEELNSLLQWELQGVSLGT